jgi:hypothetical protein
MTGEKREVFIRVPKVRQTEETELGGMEKTLYGLCEVGVAANAIIRINSQNKNSEPESRDKSR